LLPSSEKKNKIK